MYYLDYPLLIPIRCYTTCLNNDPLLEETIFAFYDLVSMLKFTYFNFFQVF